MFIKNTHRICILGDSWGCGEWDLRDNPSWYGPIHLGLEQYLRYDFKLQKFGTVLNLSSPSSGNFVSLRKFENLVTTTRFDAVFWFVTDPLRDVAFIGSVEKDVQEIDATGYSNVNYQDLLDLQQKSFLASCTLADSLGANIYLIGGCHKVRPELVSNFNNLTCYIPCLTEFLCPDYSHPDIWQSRWLDQVQNRLNLDTLDRLIENKRKQDKLSDDKFKLMFYPDGCHPNRAAHKILYNKILQDFFSH